MGLMFVVLFKGKELVYEVVGLIIVVFDKEVEVVVYEDEVILVGLMFLVVKVGLILVVLDEIVEEWFKLEGKEKV